ncbi:MAG TPA: cupin domain-containing protein [Terriglobales bacterium]|nr:cupin domain-containing protein [Terriglobales bacterium]
MNHVQCTAARLVFNWRDFCFGLFEVDGNPLYAGSGDTVFAPRGTRHAFQNIGTVPGRTLLTVVPSGFDMLFQENECGAAAGHGT